MIQPEPGFLGSFDALERSFRGLRFIDDLVPAAQAPTTATVDEWLQRYQGWDVPQMYLDYLARYGGGAQSIPPKGIGLRPLATMLRYRRKRDGLGESFATRQIPLSHANIDGILRLVYTEDDSPPRVALMSADDDIVFQADSFGHYLWHSLFLLSALHKPTHAEFTAFAGVAPSDVEAFNLALADALVGAGFEVLSSDRRILCGQRGAARFATSVRGPNVGLWVAREDDYDAMMEDHADIVKTMEATRRQPGSTTRTR